MSSELIFHGKMPIQGRDAQILLYGMMDVFDQLGSLAFHDDPAIRQEYKRFRNERYARLSSHFRASFFKIDTLAYKMEECRRSVELWMERESLLKAKGEPVYINDPLCMADHDAKQDFPLYLELMAIYLRIQADTFAQLIPYLFKVNGSMSSRSFNDQRTWFIKKQMLRYPEYVDILKTKTNWFNALSTGDKRGLRELIIHYFGGVTIVTGTRPEGGVHLTASIHTQDAVVEDVFVTLKDMYHGWFHFMDAAFIYFMPVIAGNIPSWSTLFRPCTVIEHRGDYQSLWAYPVRSMVSGTA